MRGLRASVAVVAAAVTAAAGCGGGSSKAGTTSVGGDNGGGAGGATAGGSPGDGGGGVTGGGGGGGGEGGGGGGGGGGGAPACTLSAPQVLVSGIHSGYKLALDATDVYYIDVASGYAGVYRVAKSGGTPVALAPVRPIQSDGHAFDLAVDDSTVYALDGGLYDANPSSARVVIIDKASGATRYAVAPPGSDCTTMLLGQLAVAGGTVYLAQHEYVQFHDPDCSGVTARNWISVLPPGATQPIETLQIDQGGGAILADATHVFWSDNGGMFRALHGAGATPELLAPPIVDALASDGNSLFGYHDTVIWIVTAPNVYRSIYGGSQTVQGIAVDDAHVYFGTFKGIVRMAKDGSDVQNLTTLNAHAPAVDDAYVYFFAGNDLVKSCK